MGGGAEAAGMKQEAKEPGTISVNAEGIQKPGSQEKFGSEKPESIFGFLASELIPLPGLFLASWFPASNRLRSELHGTS